MLMLLDRLDELDLRVHDLRGDRRPARRGPGQADRRVPRPARARPRRTGGWAEAAVANAASGGAAHKARRELEFARVYEAHDRWLAEAGLEDFGLSIVRALELLRAHPDRREAAQAAARHVLVDEFQDTNHAQAELLYAVAADGRSLMVVGDDDQGIYRFRGASAKNIVDFRRRFPEAAELRLEVNHRSTQHVLDAAAAVVEPIADRAAKRSVALPDACRPAGAVLARPRPRRAGARGGRADRRAGRGGGAAGGAGGAHARGAARGAAGRRGAGARRRAAPGARRHRPVRAARGARRGRVAARGVRPRGGAGAPARRRRRPPRHPVGAARRRGHLRRRGGRGGGRRARPGGPRARRRARWPPRSTRWAAPPPSWGPPTRSGSRSTAPACGPRRSRPAAPRASARLAGLAALERLGREIAEREPGLDARGLAARLQGLAEIGFRGEGVAPRERIGVQVMTVHQAKGLEFDAVFVIGLVRSTFPGSDRAGHRHPRRRSWPRCCRAAATRTWPRRAGSRTSR